MYLPSRYYGGKNNVNIQSFKQNFFELCLYTSHFVPATRSVSYFKWDNPFYGNVGITHRNSKEFQYTLESDIDLLSIKCNRKFLSSNFHVIPVDVYTYVLDISCTMYWTYLYCLKYYKCNIKCCINCLENMYNNN